MRVRQHAAKVSEVMLRDPKGVGAELLGCVELKPDGPELHISHLYRYEGTNITGERVVKDAKMQLNDALIES